MFPGWLQVSVLNLSCCFSCLGSEHIPHTQLVNSLYSSHMDQRYNENFVETMLLLFLWKMCHSFPLWKCFIVKKMHSHNVTQACITTVVLITWLYQPSLDRVNWALAHCLQISSIGCERSYFMAVTQDNLSCISCTQSLMHEREELVFIHLCTELSSAWITKH